MFKLIKSKFKKKKAGLLALSIAVMALALPTSASAASSAPDFTDVTIGVDPMDMVTGALSFLGIFNGWVVLTLAIIFTPVLVWMIFWLVGKVRKAMAK